MYFLKVSFRKKVSNYKLKISNEKLMTPGLYWCRLIGEEANLQLLNYSKCII